MNVLTDRQRGMGCMGVIALVFRCVLKQILTSPSPFFFGFEFTNKAWKFRVNGMWGVDKFKVNH